MSSKPESDLQSAATPHGGEVEKPKNPSPERGMKKIVFLGCAGGTLAMAIWALVYPDSTNRILAYLVSWIAKCFGWYYVALPTACLVFVVYIAVSRYGNIRIGSNDSRPEFSTLTWASMLFAGGIGTDIMLFAVSGPISHYMTPPSASTSQETVEAAREASVWTMFHYGVSGWSIYALMGMALGYLAYRRRLPLAIRSVLYPLIGRRAYGLAGDVVDLAAVLGTIFGVAASLGIGVVLINVGMNVIFGVMIGLPIQIWIVIAGVLIATLSAVSGVDKGIKFLAQLNMLLAVVLAAFVLFAGKTSYLLNALVLNVGDFIRLFPGMSMQTLPFEDKSDWMSSWTLFFFAWWVAWSPFVGMFLARISRGRTLREFVAGVLILPFSFIVVWVSIYGNAAIDRIRSGDRKFAENGINHPEQAYFDFLRDYPWFTLVAVVAAVTALIFYVTSANSAALVMATLTSKVEDPEDEGSTGFRVFWAVATGLLTVAVLSVGGIASLQAATVVMGLPFAFVLVAVMYGFFRTLREEGSWSMGVNTASHSMPLSRRGSSDRAAERPRLERATDLPTLEEADDFLLRTVAHVLHEVADEVRSTNGVEADVAESTHDQAGCGPSVTLTIARSPQETHDPFVYCVRRESVTAPATSNGNPAGCEIRARLEVHLRSGGQGYDVMGFTPAQLIRDVLDQYEKHVEFLRVTSALGTMSGSGGLVVSEEGHCESKRSGSLGEPTNQAG